MPAKEFSDQAVRIKEFREHLKMSQKEFGDIVKKSQSTIQRYETDKMFVPISVLKILKKKFGFNYDYFYDNKGPMKTGQDRGIIDMQQINNDQKLLMLRIASLEKTVQKLARELYSMKHGVEDN